MIRVIRLIILLALANLAQPGLGLASQDVGETLEALRYRVSLGGWSEVAVVQVRLARLGSNRYRAEFSGAAQGMWSTLSRWLPEGYETDMVLEGGRLKPQVYRETFEAGGHHVRKEYHFDYSRKVLEVWRGVDYQTPTKRREVPMQGPVYDILSLFYNIRLGALGPMEGGQTLAVAIIPNPDPRAIVFRVGIKSYQGTKIMVELTGKKGEDEAGPYFLLCDPQWVPQEAWTRVTFFGKLGGHLINPEAVVPQAGLNLPPASTKKGR